MVPLIVPPPLVLGAKVAVVMENRRKIYLVISQGIQENLHAQYKEVVLQEENKDPSQTLRDYRADLIISIGNTATTWAHKKFRDIPVIASGVVYQLDPAFLDAFPGVAIDFPIQAYLKFIHEFVPGPGKIGLLINSEKKDLFLRQFVSLSDKLGLDIIVESLSRENEFSRKVQLLEDKGVKVFLMTFDPLVMNPDSYKYLVDFCLTQRIELVVPSKALLKNGGLASLEANYEDIGRQTAKVASQILNDRSSASRLHLEFPDQQEVGINLKVADKLGVSFSPSTIMNAQYIQR